MIVDIAVMELKGVTIIIKLLGTYRIQQTPVTSLLTVNRAK